MSPDEIPAKWLILFVFFQNLNPFVGRRLTKGYTEFLLLPPSSGKPGLFLKKRG